MSTAAGASRRPRRRRPRPPTCRSAGGSSTSRAGRSRAARGRGPAPADVPTRGRIVALGGGRVAGVRVKVTAVRVPKAGDLTPVLEGLRRGEPPWVAYRNIDWNRKPPEAARLEA